MQLLVPGWTYSRYYFDFPYKPKKYSYVQAANKAGYATLAIDRIGSGASLHPLSVFNTFNADVKTVHHAVQALRDGRFGIAFKKVVVVGHSLGSLVTATEAGQYRDVDAIITTGFTHVPNYVNVLDQVAGPSVDYPARYDPKFTDSGLDLLYWTSMPGTRDTFYNVSHTDPKVIATDERLKQTQSIVELADIPTYHLNNKDRTLNIPVLDVTGAEDKVFCGFNTARCTTSKALAAYERQWYGPNAHVQAYLVPNTGHDVQLERSAPTTTARMLRFVNSYVGNGHGMIGSRPGVRPTPPPAPDAELSPLARIMNGVFVRAVRPLFNKTARTLNVIPGLGTQGQDPSHLGEVLPMVGNIDNRILGSLPAHILKTL